MIHFTNVQSTNLFLAKLIIAVPDPKTLDNLLVPKHMATGIFVNIKAGNEINPPPPTIESINPARAPAKNSIIPMSKSPSIV